MERENKNLAELDSFLTFEFDGKEYKGICIPLDSVKNEYDEDGKLLRTVESVNEENPLITEFTYDERGNCIKAETYESGIIKPKRVTTSYSEYDEAGRLIKSSSPICDRNISYDGDNEVWEVIDKINGNTTRTELKDNHDDTVELIRETTSRHGEVMMDDFRDYDSEYARKFKGYDRVIYERIDGDFIETGRTTHDELGRIVRMATRIDDEERVVERHFVEDHPELVEDEEFYLNGKLVDKSLYEHDVSTGDYTMITNGGKVKVIRQVYDNYILDRYAVKNTSDESEPYHYDKKIFFNINDEEETLTFRYKDANIFVFEYINIKKDNRLAYGLDKDGSFVLLDADIRVGDTRYTYVYDQNKSIKTKLILQKFESEDGPRFTSIESIAVRCPELIDDLNDIIIEFIKSNDKFLYPLLEEEGGIVVETRKGQDQQVEESN